MMSARQPRHSAQPHEVQDNGGAVVPFPAVQDMAIGTPGARNWDPWPRPASNTGAVATTSRCPRCGRCGQRDGVRGSSRLAD